MSIILKDYIYSLVISGCSVWWLLLRLDGFRFENE